MGEIYIGIEESHSTVQRAEVIHTPFPPRNVVAVLGDERVYSGEAVAVLRFGRIGILIVGLVILLGAVVLGLLHFL